MIEENNDKWQVGDISCNKIKVYSRSKYERSNSIIHKDEKNDEDNTIIIYLFNHDVKRSINVTQNT